jgi:beta-lactamase class A
MRSYLADPDDGAEPAATVQTLEGLWRGRLLSPASTAFLLRLMRESVHGPDRLAGGLPPGWSIAHKTGTGQHLGLLHVGTNDVGVLTAPDGHAYAVAVFIGQTIRPLAWREALMRNVARAVVQHWRVEAGAAPGQKGAGP